MERMPATRPIRMDRITASSPCAVQGAERLCGLAVQPAKLGKIIAG